MSFGSRIKTGFQFELQSLALVFRYPQLLLYWIALGVCTALNFIPNAEPSPLVRSYAVFYNNPKNIALFLIPLAIIMALFIMHAHKLLGNSSLTWSKIGKHMITILPWLIVWPFFLDIFKIIAYYVLSYDVATLTPHQAVINNLLYFVLSWSHLIWNILAAYTLIIIVVERINIGAAWIQSVHVIKNIWLEWVTGRICNSLIFTIIIFALSALYFVITASYAWGDPVIHGINTFILTGRIFVREAFQLLTYLWYKNKDDHR